MNLFLRRTTRATLVAAILGWTAAAQAVQYDTVIDIESETDLYDLAARGELETEDVDALVELLREGVDLNTAGRDELYNLPGLTYEDVDAILSYRVLTKINDPADLVAANALSEEKLLQIAPFLLLEGSKDVPVSGSARLMGAYSAEDRDPPPFFLQARGKFPYSLSAGIGMLTTRQRTGDLHYLADFNRLTADRPSYQFHLPKFFAMWKTPRFQVIAGTFRAGFGQRLTLDNTSRKTPNGAYPDALLYAPSAELSRYCRMSGVTLGDNLCGTGEGGELYVTPDFRWQDGFRGVAASLRNVSLPGGLGLSAHLIGSYESRSLYQYQMYDRSKCADPHDPDESCSAPGIYVPSDDPNSTAKYKYITLNDLYDELVAGGNVTLTFNQGAHVGVTGYWANDFFRADGAQLDFQEWANRPYGGDFGAVGVNGAARAGRVNLFLEAARSFDSMDGGGGGFGVLQRTVANIQKTHEIEFSARYYDKKFSNPLARPIAAPDRYDGQRARNETGVRLNYEGKPNEDWAMRVYADVSIWPEDGTNPNTAGMTNLEMLGRLDFVGWRDAKLSAWVQYKNKDVAVGGRGQCYDSDDFVSDPQLARPCAGEFVRFAGRVRYSPFGKKLTLAAQYQHELVDDSNRRIVNAFRQDAMAWLDVTSYPTEQLRLRWRTRYLNEHLGGADYMEDSLWSYLDVGYLPNRNWEAHVRYDAYAWLDERTSTAGRSAPVEHRFRLELETRF